MGSSNQELRQESARLIGGTTLDYNSDFLAMFAVDGFTTGTFNERFLLWLNAQLGASYTSLPAAMQAFAVDQGYNNWSSMSSFGPAFSSQIEILTRDGSRVLTRDGSTVIARP